MALTIKEADMRQQPVWALRELGRAKAIFGIEAVPDDVDLVGACGILPAPLGRNRIRHGDDAVGAMEDQPLQEGTVRTGPAAGPSRVSQQRIAEVGDPLQAIAALQP